MSKDISFKDNLVNQYGRFPVGFSGASDSTYDCDYGYWDTVARYVVVGGHCIEHAYCGAFYCFLNNAATTSSWVIGACLSLGGLGS